MAVWSEVDFRRITKFQRVDAEFYKPEYEAVINTLFHAGVLPLGYFISELTDGKHGGVTYTDSGVQFIRNQNIKNGLVTIDDMRFISEKESSESLRAELKPYDIVITTIGTLGQVGIVPNDLGRATINQNLVRLSSKQIDPHYLAVFLMSKYGKMQIVRLASGNVQPIIVYPNLRKVFIFDAKPEVQNKIGGMLRDVMRLNKEAEALCTQAQHLLESELGLDKLNFKKPVGYTARFSDTFISGRFDADFFQVPFRQIHKHLDSIKTARLSDLVDLVKGIEVGSKTYSFSGYPFLRVSNIKEKGIELGASDKYISESTYHFLANGYQPKIGELLLTKDGTPGICYAVDESINGIISGGIVRLLLKTNHIPLEYLALVINSKACQMQVEQECSGALIIHWKPSSIRKLRIPLIKESRMQEIADLVTQSKDAQRDSMRLLNQAKTRVEQLIEEAAQS